MSKPVRSAGGLSAMVSAMALLALAPQAEAQPVDAPRSVQVRCLQGANHVVIAPPGVSQQLRYVLRPIAGGVDHVFLRFGHGADAYLLVPPGKYQLLYGPAHLALATTYPSVIVVPRLCDRRQSRGASGS